MRLMPKRLKVLDLHLRPVMKLEATGHCWDLHLGCWWGLSARCRQTHELLLRRLEQQFGLRGIVLEWFRSHLSGRTLRVIFSGSTSSIIYIVCSVEHGSVLGPLLFIVYTADVADIAKKHGTRVCWRHTGVTSLSSHWYDVSCRSTGTTHCRYRPLDVSKPTLGRIETAFLSKVAVFQYYNLVPTLLQPATTSVYWL